MAIEFTKIEKIQIRKYLIHVLIVLALFFAIYYLRKFLAIEVVVELPTAIEKMEIDFSLFEKEKEFFENLLPFSEIVPGKEKGRENPFLPY